MKIIKPKEFDKILTDPDHPLTPMLKLFWTRLAEANEYIHQECTEEQKMLTTLSRMMSGSDVCSALAFDGEKFFIATNRNEHEDVDIVYSIFVVFLASNSDDICVQLELELQIGGVKTMHTYPRKVWYKRQQNFWVPYWKENSEYFEVDVVSFSVPPKKHASQELFEDIQLDCTLEKFSTQLFPFEKNPFRSGPPVRVNTLFHNVHVSYDPLHRRAETVLKHLTLICKLGDRISPRTQAAVEKNRIRIWMNSLVWEMTQWYASAFLKKKERKDENVSRKLILDKHPEVLDLAEQLNFIFQSMSSPSRNNPIWNQKVKEAIQNGPKYIRDKPSEFIQRVNEYFEDMIQLEEFVKQANNPFARALHKTFDEGASFEVVSDLEDVVHAEIRLLHRFQQSETPPTFFGISKYCCAHCTWVLKNIGGNISTPGSHGRLYPWTLSSCLKDDPLLWEALLGSELFQEYENAKGETQEQFVDAIQSIVNAQETLQVMTGKSIVFRKVTSTAR